MERTLLSLRQLALPLTTALLLLLFEIFSPCLGHAANDPAKMDLPKVSLEIIKPQNNNKQILLPVKVEAKIQSIVNADTEGHITRLLKPLGAKVKAGEVVLYIENKDPGFTYAPVPVRAPITGILSQIWITQMSKVNRGEKLFTLIDPNQLKLTGEFPNSDLGAVHSGMLGQLKVNSNKSETFTIRLVGVSPIIDPRTGTASAELEFVPERTTSTTVKKSTLTLPSIGSVGQAQFEVSQGEVLLIPEAALIYRDGKPLVRILQGENKFIKKGIELGEQRDATYVVKSGIAKGDKIIVRSSRPLKEGETVQVENENDLH